MDRTPLLQATVKTIRLRQKAQRRDNGSLNESTILSSSKSSYKRTHFAEESNDLAMRISKLRDFLLEHRKDYVNSLGHLISECVPMTDAERDQIDNDAEQFIQKLSEEIANLRKDVHSTGIGRQAREHRQAVCESLSNYLKAVCKLYSEQKAIRVKRIVDRKRTARLQPDGLMKPVLSPSLPPELTTTDHNGTEQSGEETVDTDNEEDESPLPVNRRTADNERVMTNLNTAADDHLTEEERVVFSQENEQMFTEMSSLVDEVRQVEGKVIEISRLQEIFAEKILSQSHLLDIAADQTVTASENVLSGNEQVRQAIKNKASLRLWILFILIMCSFSLLFLHWYSS